MTKALSATRLGSTTAGCCWLVKLGLEEERGPIPVALEEEVPVDKREDLEEKGRKEARGSIYGCQAGQAMMDRWPKYGGLGVGGVWKCRARALVYVYEKAKAGAGRSPMRNFKMGTYMLLHHHEGPPRLVLGEVVGGEGLLEHLVVLKLHEEELLVAHDQRATGVPVVAGIQGLAPSVLEEVVDQYRGLSGHRGHGLGGGQVAGQMSEQDEYSRGWALNQQMSVAIPTTTNALL